MRVDLDWDERQKITELLTEYRENVAGGIIVGYGQTRQDELDVIDGILRKVDPIVGGA